MLLYACLSSLGALHRLFPTSAHDSVEEAVRGGTMTEGEGRAILAKCATSALRLLERCVQRGQVIICSNGDRSWWVVDWTTNMRLAIHGAVCVCVPICRLAESLDGEAYQELRQFLKARAIPSCRPGSTPRCRDSSSTTPDHHATLKRRSSCKQAGVDRPFIAACIL